MNAFQSQADVVIQKSTREGFGLTVSEALWKARPFIGGDVGGIPLQVRDGETRLPRRPPPRSAPSARWASCASRAWASSSAGRARSTCASTSSRHASCATGCVSSKTCRSTEPGAPTRPGLEPRPRHLRPRRTTGTLEPQRGGGGLVTALTGLVHHRDALWIASTMSEEDAEAAREHGGRSFDCELDGVTYRIRLVESDPDGLRAVLQRGGQPDAVVHPALPVGPVERAGHPPVGGGRLRGRLLRGEPRPGGCRAGGDRGRGGARS